MSNTRSTRVRNGRKKIRSDEPAEAAGNTDGDQPGTDEEREPLSLAEEIAEEADRGDDDARALREDQARRDPHRRAAEDEHVAADRGGPQRKRQRRAPA